jgi:hypothetical protein
VVAVAITALMLNPLIAGAAMKRSHLSAMAVQATDVMFIAWTQSGSQIRGRAEVAALSGLPPEESITISKATVSGQQYGSTFYLEFDGGMPQFGVYLKRYFTLDDFQIQASSDGSTPITAPNVTFYDATESQFEKAVAAMESNPQRAAQSAQAGTINEATEQVDSEANQVDKDFDQMKEIEQMLAIAVKKLPTLVQKARNPLTAAQNDSNKLAASQRTSSSVQHECALARSATTDSNRVGSDGLSLETATTSLGTNSYFVDLTGLTYALQGDFTNLQQTEQDLGIDLSSAPTQNDVNLHVFYAQSAINAALKVINTDAALMDFMESKAYTSAVDASKSGHCGQPHQPVMLSSISYNLPNIG